VPLCGPPSQTTKSRRTPAAAAAGAIGRSSLGFLARQQRQGLVGQLTDEFAEEFGVENPAGLAEGAKGGALATQKLLHLGKLTGLLDAAQALDDGVKEIEQQQRCVLVQVQQAVARFVAGRARAVQAIQQWPEDLEILQAPKILRLQGRARLARHRTIRTGLGQAGPRALDQSHDNSMRKHHAGARAILQHF
jgi:hypothetical protein